MVGAAAKEKLLMRADLSALISRSRSSRLGRRNRQSSKQRRAPRLRHFERLENREFLHGSPVLDAEHLAVFGSRDATSGIITGGLVPDSAVTYISVASTTPE